VAALAADQLNQLSRRAPGDLARLDGCRFMLGSIQENVRVPLLRGEYEKPERAAIKRFLKRELPVIELGGSIGVIACVTNRALADPRRHVVLEADPDLIPRLMENRSLNRCGFEILNRAVGYGAAEVSFFTCFDSRGGGIHDNRGKAVRVPAITLEQVAYDFGFPRCTLICDIEGAEVDLVENEAAVLAKLVDTLILEIHPKIMGQARIDAMLAALSQNDFEVIHSQSYVLTLRNQRLQPPPG
jgi:FkbM family methyltransferase